MKTLRELNLNDVETLMASAKIKGIDSLGIFVPEEIDAWTD
jgi:hypothetical protein